MNLKTLRALYIQQLKDLYSTEKLLMRMLPMVVRAATNAKLKSDLEHHWEETKKHVVRLGKLLFSHKQTTYAPVCKVMAGLFEEGRTLIAEQPDPETLDVGLIDISLRMEDYEIASYGTAQSLADFIGDKAGKKILQQMLDEEEAMDKKLGLARSEANIIAPASDELQKWPESVQA